MDEPTRPRFDRPAVKLAVFACTLGAVLGGGAIIGATVGPEPTEPAAHEHGSATETPEPAASSDTELPGGLAMSRDGYSLALDGTSFPAGREFELAFTITGPDGEPVTAFDVEHDKELHLIVVSRDLTEYLHLHPERDGAGMWRTTVPSRAAGSYRVFADFTPEGSASVTLGADVAIPGDFAPADLPEPAADAEVDGYTVSLDGPLVAGEASQVTLRVASDGQPVDDIEPYLGALGHLVAIRAGDLAYLHVHPAEAAETPGGPSVEFTVEVPTAGQYRLFFDFAHGGDVRTAPFTVAAARSDAPGPGTTDALRAGTTEGDGHGGH